MLSSEAQFQTAVGKLALAHGVLHYHTHDSRRSESGFPDSVFCGRGVLFRELKLTRRSRVRPEQKIWIEALTVAGCDAGIWYAEDYHSGLVDDQLRDLAIRNGARGGRRSTPMPPMSLRLAKQLYINSALGEGPPGRAALLWEAGVTSVGHEQWIDQAQTTLGVVAGELPATDQEHLAWLAAHGLGVGAGVAAIMSALKSELTARPAQGQLAVPFER
jgi:hypothetical protein